MKSIILMEGSHVLKSEAPGRICNFHPRPTDPTEHLSGTLFQFPLSIAFLPTYGRERAFTQLAVEGFLYLGGLVVKLGRQVCS